MNALAVVAMLASSAPRTAVVVADGAGPPAATLGAVLGEALQSTGQYNVVDRALAASLLSESKSAGLSCALADAKCWVRVGLGGDLERLVVVGSGASTVDVRLVDVATGREASRILARVPASPVDVAARLADPVHAGATLVLDGFPADAAVAIDGVDVALPPEHIVDGIEEGAHVIRVAANDYRVVAHAGGRIEISPRAVSSSSPLPWWFIGAGGAVVVAGVALAGVALFDGKLANQELAARAGKAPLPASFVGDDAAEKALIAGAVVAGAAAVTCAIVGVATLD